MPAKRNWKIQKYFGRKSSSSIWFHWWSIYDLELLKADIEAMLQTKIQSGDYFSDETKLT